MAEAEAALAAMGIGVDEAVAADVGLRGRNGPRDGRVCLCGHSVGRHTVASGLVLCKPARMECPCRKLRPVVEAEDVRPFLRRTAGSGMMHALVRGIAALAVSGKSVEWIVDLTCDRCGGDEEVVPAAVTKQGALMSEATGYDALLCRKCRSGADG